LVSTRELGDAPDTYVFPTSEKLGKKKKLWKGVDFTCTWAYHGILVIEGDQKHHNRPQYLFLHTLESTHGLPEKIVFRGERLGPPAPLTRNSAPRRAKVGKQGGYCGLIEIHFLSLKVVFVRGKRVVFLM
jgi:hypothetical protein